MFHGNKFGSEMEVFLGKTSVKSEGVVGKSSVSDGILTLL